MSEKYVPSEEEMALAENSMTESQKDDSKAREANLTGDWPRAFTPSQEAYISPVEQPRVFFDYDNDKKKVNVLRNNYRGNVVEVRESVSLEQGMLEIDQEIEETKRHYQRTIDRLEELKHRIHEDLTLRT